jgi:signal transduction histidine kinase
MTVVVAMLALGVSALLLTSHRITRSIQKLHEGTILISHGNLNRRVEIKGADEIAKLAEAFNAMAQHLELDITERKRAEEQLKSSYEQLRALSARIQSIREEERTTIAREIHDELGQALTGLKMDLSWLRKKIPEEELIEKTQSMLKLIDSTIQTVRKISTELRPGILDDLGLIAAIEWQAGDFQSRTGIKCEFDSSLEEVALEREVSTAIFRIVQETLTNVVRHANATQVNIKVGEEDGILLVEIEDNGRGITGKEVSSPKSLGLLGMRERAHLFGGELEIKGTSGERTVVMVRIPLRTKDDRRNTKLIRHLS